MRVIVSVRIFHLSAIEVLDAFLPEEEIEEATALEEGHEMRFWEPLVIVLRTSQEGTGTQTED